MARSVHTPCGHAVVEIWKDSNRNRTRCKVSCLACRRSWYGCKALRLGFGLSVGEFDVEPHENAEVWGPVGVQQWHDAEFEV